MWKRGGYIRRWMHATARRRVKNQGGGVGCYKNAIPSGLFFKDYRLRLKIYPSAAGHFTALRFDRLLASGLFSVEPQTLCLQHTLISAP